MILREHEDCEDDLDACARSGLELVVFGVVVRLHSAMNDLEREIAEKRARAQGGVAAIMRAWHAT